MNRLNRIGELPVKSNSSGVYHERRCVSVCNTPNAPEFSVYTVFNEAASFELGPHRKRTSWSRATKVSSNRYDTPDPRLGYSSDLDAGGSGCNTSTKTSIYLMLAFIWPFCSIAPQKAIRRTKPIATILATDKTKRSCCPF